MVTLTDDTQAFSMPSWGTNDLFDPNRLRGNPLPKTLNYTVRRGDNLSKIAEAQGMSLQKLLQLNPKLRRNPNMIQPGLKINLGTPEEAPENFSRTILSPTEAILQGVGNPPIAPADAPKPMPPAVVDNTANLEVARPTIERTIGQAGAGFDVMGGSPLGMTDEDFINTPRDAFIAGRSETAPQYKNANAQRMAAIMAANPDVSKLTTSSAKELAKLARGFMGQGVKNRGGDDESTAILNQFRNWSGLNRID